MLLCLHADGSFAALCPVYVINLKIDSLSLSICPHGLPLIAIEADCLAYFIAATNFVRSC